MTLIYLQFCPYLALIYLKPYEVMRVSVIFTQKE